MVSEIADRRATALRLLKTAAQKAKRTGNVAFPPEFVRRRESDIDGVTPLERLIAGGRGGTVRLRLYLCITMMATRQPYDIRQPPTPMGWSRLLALPADSGPRRVNNNLKWLDRNRLIRLERRAAAPAAITLLSADGNGKEYTRATARYVGMPIELWTKGWLIDLSTTALALLFVLMELQGGHDTPQYVPRHRRLEYCLSPDTWTRATKELVHHGLLTVGRAPQGSDFDYKRLRNTYWIDLDRIRSEPDNAR